MPGKELQIVLEKLTDLPSSKLDFTTALNHDLTHSAEVIINNSNDDVGSKSTLVKDKIAADQQP